MKDWLNLKSLRSRYAMVTIVLAIAMLLGNGLAQRQISSVQKDIEKNIESRSQLSHRHRQIRNTLWNIHDMLSKFQIDPSLFEDSDYVHNLISQSINHTDRLSRHPWIYKNYSATVKELKDTTLSLDAGIKTLMEIRTQPEKLFPSLRIANTVMLPYNVSFIDNINLIVAELADELNSNNKEIYIDFVMLRETWIKMISNFRMYMLNRLNSFQEQYLRVQINAIEVQLATMNSYLKHFNEHEQNNQLAFEASIGLDKINKAFNSWRTSFETVKKINSSGKWRQDIVVYRNDIEPKLKKIADLLNILDIAVDDFNKQDLHTMSDTSNNLVNILWWMTVAGLILLVFGFSILNKAILYPIKNITNAIKDVAMGGQQTLTIKSSVDETQNLIDAFTEMRHQIHHRQDALEYHALHDNLTGLANRSLLTDRIQQSIHNSMQDRSEFAVLIMDLDRFKDVNDTLGHPIGDKLLAQVGKRLSQTLREVDVVARLGGDEFSVLLSHSNEEQSIAIAKKILTAFEKVFHVNELELYIGISIGIAIYPIHGLTHQSLFQRADIAMYVAKRSRNGYAIYDSHLDPHSVGRLALASDLKNAIEKNQFKLKYQPVIQISESKVIGMEALLRWNHPIHGDVSPMDIIPLAEQTGLIKEITQWVLSTAIAQCNHLKSVGIDLRVAVNLSVYNLQEIDLVDSIKNHLDLQNVNKSNLVLEVTESAMMMDPERAIEILSKFDKMGIELAIDDFGTGFSSLSYLKQLPVDMLKIDKSFIMDMCNDENDAVIVKSTIDLAHNLGIKVVAEGIEDNDTLELLDILGCEYGQGFHISHPLDADELVTWITEKQH